MLYRPDEGRIWDPTVVYYNKKFYMFTMFFAEEGRDSFAMRLAVSDDAVHWEDKGCVLDGGEHPVWKMNIHRLADGRFALNHGSMSFKSGHGNDTLYYFVSDDLVKWQQTGVNHPDPEWYDEEERWDHMAVIPSEKGGYIGYVVATPKKEIGGMIGIQRSDDGINWKICPPPEIMWNGCEPVREMEVGGCVKKGDKWYLIGGICPPFEGNYAYSCYTFKADSEDGPFYPDKEALRLCGFNGRQGDLFVQALAAFVRNYENGDTLVTNSIIYEYDDKMKTTWFLPIKRAEIDENGHLRLKYYEKNDALKGNLIAEEAKIELRTDFAEGYMLEDKHRTVALPGFDPDNGCVIEGKLRVSPYPGRGPVRAGCWRPTSAGFTIGSGQGKGTAILAECTNSKNRKTSIGRLYFGDGTKHEYVPEDVIAPGCACPTGLDTGVTHTFRVIIRYGMFELYFDDYHIQSYTMKDVPDGKMYFTAVNAECTIEDYKVYGLTL